MGFRQRGNHTAGGQAQDAVVYFFFGLGFKGAWARSDAATFFTVAGLLGDFSCLDAAFAAALPVCFGFVAMANSLLRSKLDIGRNDPV